jgi:TrmH family RNA methyltransferase
VSVISRARVKYLRSLGKKKVRTAEGRFVVEGLHVVEEAVASGRAEELFLSDEASDTPRGKALLESGVPVTQVGPADVAALRETETPVGAFALVTDPVTTIDAHDWKENATLLIADGVADPGNFGTLVRSAAALGCDGVVVTQGTVEPTNPKAVRATAGALFLIPIVRSSRDEVREKGFALWIADKGGEPIDRLDTRPERVALLVGNEPRGVSDDARADADKSVAISVSEGVESLNVAVAAGILLFAMRHLPVRA